MFILQDQFNMDKSKLNWGLMSGIYPTVWPGRRYDPAGTWCFIGKPTDRKPADVKSDRKPADVKSDRKPTDVKSYGKPADVKSDGKPTDVKPDGKPDGKLDGKSDCNRVAWS